ncbi:ABC transporter ATP-binding protein [Hyphomicrobium sp. 2TAF46]|uniref:ABC transporter ATP-binding protein n=1 Tax=Hyphomicrobium sp. 2TAF46 TaxID=3233019 RepID=UPI003F8FE1F7
MIELRAVSKDYNGHRVIDTVSLKVETGERVALFGPSGCGKSTVLHLIAGLVIPDAGDILIDGEFVATAHKNLREPQERGIGLVFQDLALWPHMTVSENIAFGLRAKGIPQAEREERVREMVGLVRLGDYLNARPAELSGGQQQRVALARALALRPRIVLMDEPLSTLDEELNLQLRQEILRLHGELKFTLVYVTHSRDEAAALATRIVYFRQGRLDTTPRTGRTA